MGCRLIGFVWTVVVADTSLYIPGFNEQPVSVTNIGVDSNGRTTWQMVPGKPTGAAQPLPPSLTGKFASSLLSCFAPTKNIRLPPSTWMGGGVVVFRKKTVANRFLFCAVTMIQGPSDAVVHASFPQIQVSLSCALSSGMADCLGQIQQPGATITTSIRESMKPYLVQGGGSDGGSPPSPTPAPSQSGTLSSSGNDNGSSLKTGVMDIGMLVGGVVTGIAATLFMV